RGPALITVLFAIWLLGTVYLLVRLALGAVVLRRIVRGAISLDTPDWRCPLLEAADRLSLDQPPRLLMSDRLPMPFACGLRQPTIVLPASASEWTDRRRRAVLSHELAHLRRFDLIVNAVGQLASALYWFHPLVRFAARKLRTEGERACDDLVLGVGTRASEYANHLLHIACQAGRSRSPGLAMPMAQRHEFEGRMLAILEPGARRDPTTRTRAALLASLAVAFVIPLAALVPSSPAEGRAPVQQPAASPLPLAGPAPAAEPAPDGPRPHLRTHIQTQVQSRMQMHERESMAAASAPGDSDRTQVVAALVRLLRDTVVDVRLDAVTSLGHLQAAEAIVPLGERLTRDPAPTIREMAAWALGEIQDKGSIEVLALAVRHDASAAVRITAVWALGEIDDAAAVPTLTAALADPSPDVADRAAWALGTIQPDHAPPALVAALRSSAPAVRSSAAWALGQIADSATAGPISALLNDPDADVRHAALWALGQVGGSVAQGALVHALDSSDPEVRAKAARALGGSGADPWPRPMPIVR
ncbi:MAG: HEAT repeat domain-containing protein, partial [Gemmatimonadales bacterium]